MRFKGAGERSTKSLAEQLSKEGWRDVHAIVLAYAHGKGHLDQLKEGREWGYSHGLLMDTFRFWLVGEALLKGRLRKSPRDGLMALLRIGTVELLTSDPSRHPLIVHHSVQMGRELGYSKQECGLVNAVLRALLREGLPDLMAPETQRLAHPAWMWRRWKCAFGEADALALLRWNLSPSEWYLYAAGEPPEGAEATPWEGYFRGTAQLLEQSFDGASQAPVFVQDPFARHAVELLGAQSGEFLVDACAAPGGKSRRLLQGLQGSGRLVCIDRPGKRLERLKAVIGDRAEVLGKDLRAVNLAALGGAADGLLLDVPCSNTGVMRGRPDVKLRLSEADIAQQAAEQLTLLESAAALVKPGGRLVYSTCSIEVEENENVVMAYLEAHPDWKLAETRLSYPWEAGHDGGGAFLLTLKN
jgi:16S rRNA (cytosine967-C5)-methyltransferase